MDRVAVTSIALMVPPGSFVTCKVVVATLCESGCGFFRMRPFGKIMKASFECENVVCDHSRLLEPLFQMWDY